LAILEIKIGVKPKQAL